MRLVLFFSLQSNEKRQPKSHGHWHWKKLGSALSLVVAAFTLIQNADVSPNPVTYAQLESLRTSIEPRWSITPKALPLDTLPPVQAKHKGGHTKTE